MFLPREFATDGCLHKAAQLHTLLLLKRPVSCLLQLHEGLLHSCPTTMAISQGCGLSQVGGVVVSGVLLKSRSVLLLTARW